MKWFKFLASPRQWMEFSRAPPANPVPCFVPLYRSPSNIYRLLASVFCLAPHRAGVSPAEAIFIGDTYSTDMGGAQLAGIHGVHIDRVGAYSHAQFPRIITLPELDRILEGLLVA